MQYVLASGLGLVLLVVCANLLVDLYARAAVRDALDEGVHAALPVDAAAGACEARAREVLVGLLRGPLGDDVRVACADEADQVRATARVVLPGWLPGVPDWRFRVEAVATRES